MAEPNAMVFIGRSKVVNKITNVKGLLSNIMLFFKLNNRWVICIYAPGSKQLPAKPGSIICEPFEAEARAKSVS
jgi:hypothetical protein